MFASRWSQSAGHTAWMGDSHVVRAASPNLYGPYTDQGLAFTDNDGLGHNVNVLKLRAGDACGKQYAITLSGGVPGSGRVYGADFLTGPWTFLGEVQVAAGSNFSTRNNMQIILRPDGTYEAIESRGIVAISENVMGPYVAQGDSFYSILQETADLGKLEDPTLWYSGGKYHVITNEWNMRKAFHLYSEDGKTNWQLDTGLAYDPTADFVRYADGTVNHWRKIERPRAYIENGHVAAFTFAAINVEKEQDLGNDRHGSKVIVVPFDGVAFDRDLQTRPQAGHAGRPLTFCNPLDLPYRFTPKDNFLAKGASCREAADPTVVFHKGQFWLFAARCGGYWHSKDMVHWDFIEPTGFPLEGYAPTVAVVNGKWVLLTSAGRAIYVSDEIGRASCWERV